MEADDQGHGVEVRDKDITMSAEMQDAFSLRNICSPEVARRLGWSEEEIIARFGRLQSNPPLSQEVVDYIVGILQSKDDALI